MALRFITKRHRVTDSSGAILELSPTPNTIHGLYGNNIIVSNTGLAVYIIAGGQIAAYLSLDKIANWEISGPLVIVHSIDEQPLQLNFVTSNDAITGITIIQNAINNL